MHDDPVRQHWVPKVYLRSFCRELQEREQIHVRDVQAGRNFVSAIDRVAVIRHFYTLGLGTAQPSYVVESTLAELESKVQPVLSSIKETADLPIDEASRQLLAEFVATLHMRSRQGLEMIRGYRADVRAGLRLNEPTDERAQGFDGQLNDYDDEQMRELFAKASVVVGKRVATTLKGMRWRLLRASSGHFITSENPVFSYHPTETRWGLGTPGAHTIFPMSPALLIHISEGVHIPGTGTVDVPPQGVHGLNGLTLLAAKRYLFSHRPFDDIATLIEDREPGSPPAFGPAGDEVMTET